MASINFLTSSASIQEIILDWKMTNTRHVFLSRIVRLDAGSAGVGSITLKHDEKIHFYSLTVETRIFKLPADTGTLLIRKPNPP